jgi:hypothetical protein
MGLGLSLSIRQRRTAKTKPETAPTKGRAGAARPQAVA